MESNKAADTKFNYISFFGSETSRSKELAEDFSVLLKGVLITEPDRELPLCDILGMNALNYTDISIPNVVRLYLLASSRAIKIHNHILPMQKQAKMVVSYGSFLSEMIYAKLICKWEYDRWFSTFAHSDILGSIPKVFVLCKRDKSYVDYKLMEVYDGVSVLDEYKINKYFKEAFSFVKEKIPCINLIEFDVTLGVDIRENTNALCKKLIDLNLL